MMRNIRVREGKREGSTAEWQNRKCGNKEKVAIQLWEDHVVSASFCYCRLSLVYCLCSVGQASMVGIMLSRIAANNSNEVNHTTPRAPPFPSVA
ncbi:hypothetical protein E2C01_041885 [Portunus trituberculatus]|uniref:Uncharacterized protein n=1 Tax=Portunus trituberculatus TaxID=210409 RepID=A0A5B7FS70_PORTR|nr:hypothetical protein [Portunus trituberculatus]